MSVLGTEWDTKRIKFPSARTEKVVLEGTESENSEERITFQQVTMKEDLTVSQTVKR